MRQHRELGYLIKSKLPAMHDVDTVEPSARQDSRATWPIRKFRLGEEPAADLRASTTAEERLMMMWTLACDAWAVAGRPIPDYERGNAPIRVVRRAEGNAVD